MTLLSLLVVYYVIWSLLFLRSDVVSSAQKKNHLTAVIVSVTLVVPLLVFEVSTCRKTSDRVNQLTFFKTLGLTIS